MRRGATIVADAPARVATGTAVSGEVERSSRAVCAPPSKEAEAVLGAALQGHAGALEPWPDSLTDCQLTV